MSTYSKYWRRSWSHEESAELALSLRALRKVAGHIGGNVGPVFWKGMAEGEDRAILLDPAIVKGGYPIPFESFDLLVGTVVREGLGSQEWSEWVVARVTRSLSGLSEHSRLFLAAFLQAAEDIYVDAIGRARAWSLYLSGLWRAELAGETRSPGLPPGAASLARMWKRKTFTGDLPERLHPDYLPPLDLLKECTAAIRGIAALPVLTKRRESRAALYLEVWPLLYRLLSEWEEYADSPNGISLFDEAAPKRGRPAKEEAIREDEKERDQEEDQGLDPDLAEEVKSLLGEDKTEVTRALLVAVQDPEAASMKTFFRHGVARTSVPADPALVQRLRRVFRVQEMLARKARRRRDRRALAGGQLDVRRLHRVPIDGKAFKSREALSASHSWHICIVADASASMAGKGVRQKPWPIVERVFASLAEAVKGSPNRLDILAYHEEQTRCTITRLHHGGELYTVVPSGRTPSGQAILAAALQFKKMKRTMMIHVTDGASNCGLRLGEAVDHCRRSSIELVTIGCGCSAQTEDFLKAVFPERGLCLLQDIRALPAALERVLRRKILFSVQ